MSCPNLSGRLARWSLRLQDFDFDIVHKLGTSNQVPDALYLTPFLPVSHHWYFSPIMPLLGALTCVLYPLWFFSDREHLRQMQLNDPDTGKLLRMLEVQDESYDEELSRYVIQDWLLYFVNDKVSYNLHPMKHLKLYAPTAMKRSIMEYYHNQELNSSGHQPSK